MMRKPSKCQVWSVADRRYRGVPRPWVVRWKVDGKEHNRAFATKTAAEDHRARLLVASRDGLRFDRTTGEPTEWSGSDVSFVDFAADWVERQATTWAPATLLSAVEALTRAVPLAVGRRAPAAPSGMRAHLKALLSPGSESDDAACDAWLRRWSLSLADLDAEAIASVHYGLSLKDDGSAFGAATASRMRKTTKAMLEDAVALGKLAALPWPAPRRSLRRSERTAAVVDVALLPDAETAMRIIEAIQTHQPGSRGIQLLSQVCWYIGCRPSEARALRVEDFILPESGWGQVRIERSLDVTGVDGPTKTGLTRVVPVPPQLVELVRNWVGDRTTGRLVVTRGGKAPELSNWNRALARACDAVGVPRISPYDLRHCAATLMIGAGALPGEVAKRLGNSVEVLTRVYVGVMMGDEATSNERIESALGRVSTAVGSEKQC